MEIKVPWDPMEMAGPCRVFTFMHPLSSNTYRYLVGCLDPGAYVHVCFPWGRQLQDSRMPFSCVTTGKVK